MAKESKVLVRPLTGIIHSVVEYRQEAGEGEISYFLFYLGALNLNSERYLSTKSKSNFAKRLVNSHWT